MDSSDQQYQQQLVQRFIDGDKEAVKELLMSSFDWLHGYIVSLIPQDLRWSVQADDVLQEVYVRVFRNLDSFKPEGHRQMMSWLKTIARNTCFDELRKQKRKKHVPPISSSLRDSRMLSLIEELVVDEDMRVSRLIQAKEKVSALEVAISSLPEDYREIVKLLYIQELPIKEVAEITGRTEGSIRGIRSRAREQLRELLVRLSLYE